MHDQDLPAIDENCALFLDFDGTLAELAPRPDAVAVSEELIDTLRRLHARLSGAVAVVSGRPLAQLDRLLAPLQLPGAGVHGVERRRADGQMVCIELSEHTAALDRLAVQAEALATQHAGLLVERKPGAVALHYRLAPAFEAACLGLMAHAVAREPALALLHGKAVVEVKPQAATKGRAIEAFMHEPPFVGRQPLFAGDDITDEAGFAAVHQLGGHSIKVGGGVTLAHSRLPDPKALRDWLRGAAIQVFAS